MAVERRAILFKSGTGLELLLLESMNGGTSVLYWRAPWTEDSHSTLLAIDIGSIGWDFGCRYIQHTTQDIRTIITTLNKVPIYIHDEASLEMSTLVYECVFQNH